MLDFAFYKFAIVVPLNDRVGRAAFAGTDQFKKFTLLGNRAARRDDRWAWGNCGNKDV